MSKTVSPADVFSKVVAELQKLGDDGRARTIKAILAFFDQEGLQPRTDDRAFTGTGGSGISTTRRMTGGAVAYFDQKQPKSKVEEIAVAARYREEVAKAEMSTQEELRAVFSDARRNFDARNFRRDIENARNKNLFTRGTGRGVVQLSAVGQKLVDSLPDRSAAKALTSKTRTKKKKD
jgi:hypothetical protein